MGKRTIIVKRKAYGRRAYGRKDGTKVRATQVKATEYEMVDLGVVGKGKKVLPEIEEGKMTRDAIKLGYIKEDQKIKDIPNEKIDDFALDLANKIGNKKTRGMFQWQVNIRKGRREKDVKQFRKKMEIGVNAIEKKIKKSKKQK